jgi:hypothetical protein
VAGHPPARREGVEAKAAPEDGGERSADLLVSIALALAILDRNRRLLDEIADVRAEQRRGQDT